MSFWPKVSPQLAVGWVEGWNTGGWPSISPSSQSLQASSRGWLGLPFSMAASGRWNASAVAQGSKQAGVPETEGAAASPSLVQPRKHALSAPSCCLGPKQITHLPKFKGRGIRCHLRMGSGRVLE